ncbi:MAG: pyridoxal-phosphate dependent enzyme, partial [Saprospiraceae bacterium]
SLIDHFEKVTDKDAALAARRLAREEGLLLGYSAGSALAGLHQMRDQLKPSDIVVILFHDHGSRYIGKLYNDDWMRERGFIDNELKVKDLILYKKDKKFISVDAGETVKAVLHTMKEMDISQLPVMQNDKIVGSVTESHILEFILNNPLMNSEKKVSEIMDAPFPKVNLDLPVRDLSKYISKNTPAVIAEDLSGDLIVLTQYDIIQAL